MKKYFHLYMWGSERWVWRDVWALKTTLFPTVKRTLENLPGYWWSKLDLIKAGGGKKVIILSVFFLQLFRLTIHEKRFYRLQNKSCRVWNQENAIYHHLFGRSKLQDLSSGSPLPVPYRTCPARQRPQSHLLRQLYDENRMWRELWLCLDCLKNCLTMGYIIMFQWNDLYKLKTKNLMRQYIHTRS